MFEPKVPAVCAAIGFVLSFLIGLFSGAAFLVVLLRALAMAVMFAGLAFGGRFLLQRFVPDLLVPVDEPGVEADDSGNVVNITIGENEKDGMPFSGSDSAGQDASIPDFLQSVRREGDPKAESPGLQAKSGFAGAGSPGPGETAGMGDSVATSVSSVSSASAPPRSGSGTSGGLDVLPDLMDFIPDVKGETESAGVSDGTTPVSSESSTRFDASDLKGAAVESETMARAIRTILSRDS